MEIATPARSSPFPKITFDHKLIIAKHLVSNNDEKRKTPNHLNREDESSTCDLKEKNYENGAKSRLNDSNVIDGTCASSAIDKPATVGVKPITVQQRQDDMPTKMNNNNDDHHGTNGRGTTTAATTTTTIAAMMVYSDEEMCNNINRDNTSVTTNTTTCTATDTSTSLTANCFNNISKLSSDAHESLVDRSKATRSPASVTVDDGHESNRETSVQKNCNSNSNNNNAKSDKRNLNYNENYSKDVNTIDNTFNSERHVSSSGNSTFKVPEIATNDSYNTGSSSPTSPSIPYRKQSVFVAPAGLNRIIHKNRNNHHHHHPQQQQQQQHQISIKTNPNDLPGVSISTFPTTYTSSYSSLPSTPSLHVTSLCFSSSFPSSSIPTLTSSSLTTSTTPATSTVLSSPIGSNGIISYNNSSSISSGNFNSSSCSNSSSFARKNSTGLQPKVNAQEIEQHISKIISENAAIVETLDPLWSKRYLSRHSVSSLPSGSSTASSLPSSSSTSYPTGLTSSNVTTNNLPSRRYSEIVVDPSHASGSKLQSALLGKILSTCSLTSGTTVVTPSNVPHAHQHLSQKLNLPSNQNGPTKKFSEPTYPSVIINLKQQHHHQQQQQQQQQQLKHNSMINKSAGIETGLGPSLVRNLLTSSKSSSVKVISVPVSSSSSSCSPSTVSQISTVVGLTSIAGDNNINRNIGSTASSTAIVATSMDTTDNVNPDNPEGSIIKDLLLKARDSGETNERRLSRANHMSIPPIQEELSMLVYVCTLCKIAFRNKEILEAHQLNYCKANETQSTNELSLNQLQLLNDHVQRKISVMESNFLQQQLTKPVQSSSTSSQHISSNPGNNIFSQPQPHHTSNNKPLNQLSSTSVNQPTVGNILKQQLLAPTAGPPLKKRKTSEPLFTKSHLNRFNHHNSHHHHPPHHHSHHHHLHHHQQQQQQSNYNQYPSDINSHYVRKASVVQGPQHKLSYIKSTSNNNGKEGTIESDCSNSGLSPLSSSSPSTLINDNHVISVYSESLTFFPTSTTVTQSMVSFPQSYNFVNQSSLDKSSSLSANHQKSISSLDILPDYYPHLKHPATKVTLSGPIMFPILKKILVENKENIEFQASSEALQSPTLSLSSSSSSSVQSSSIQVNPSGQTISDITNTNNNYLVYKQIPSIPEFDEEQMVDEKNFDDKFRPSSLIKADQQYEGCPEYPDVNNVDLKKSNLLDNNHHYQSAKDEGQSNKGNGHLGENDGTGEKMTSIEDDCDSELIRNSSSNGLSTKNRPTSLILKKSFSPLTAITAHKLIGSTLASPDTPRPKRKCMQLYIKGQTYTYLGLKMSTRSTYCCIYRPQPMYVPQEASSKLSMYSNWQIISPHDDIFKLMTPNQLFHAHDTRQWCFKGNGIKVTFAPSLESSKALADSFILTPSSYWSNKQQSEEKAAIKRELLELKRKGFEDLTDSMDSNNNNNISTGSNYNYNSKSVIFGGNSRKTSEDRCSTMSGFDSDSNDPNQPKRVKIFEGGFKSNEDYTYVRGRGRGKYVCEECGIRCKKPSMLKKHIRTHTDLRPYSCRHCAFAFKTKGNLTKHMKSKAHHKKCVELGIIPVPITIDDSQIDCEALAKQEALERSYSGGHLASDDDENDPDDEDGCEEEEDDGSDDEGVPIPIITSSGIITEHRKMDIDELGAVGLGLSRGSEERKDREQRKSIIVANEIDEQEVARSLLVLSGSGEWSVTGNPAAVAAAIAASASGVTAASNRLEAGYTCDNQLASSPPSRQQQFLDVPNDLRKISTQSSTSSSSAASAALSTNKHSFDDKLSLPSPSTTSSLSTSAVTITNSSHYVNIANWTPNLTRQRSFSFSDGLIRRNSVLPIHNNFDFNYRCLEKQSVPLSLTNCHQLKSGTGDNRNPNDVSDGNNVNSSLMNIPGNPNAEPIDDSNDSEVEDHFQRRYSMSVIQDRHSESLYLNSEGPIDLSRRNGDTDNPIPGPSCTRFDQSLPGRRYTLSTPSAASHHLSRAELMTAINGSASSAAAASFGIITREDGKSVCRKCNKSFPELAQLILHVKAHYFERPFRCNSCGISFRTRGHLQKHEKSVSHSDKVKINLTFGAPTTDNPRPFKCDDCITAFRIHGHLAKHLRSKNHIMKLECTGKLPCGMLADMERFGINIQQINIIDTADCESSRSSLQKLAEKMYSQNGEVDLNWLRQSTITEPTATTNNCNPNDDNMDDNTEDIEDIADHVNSNGNDGEDGDEVTSNSTCMQTSLTSPTAPVDHMTDVVISDNTNHPSNNLTNPSAVNNVIVNHVSDKNNNVNDNFNGPHYGYNNCNSNLIVNTSSSLSSLSSPSLASTSSVSISPPSAAPSSSSPSSSLSTTTVTPTFTTTQTTSSTTNITSIRSNTCNYCKQVFKSAKFLQVHLYCDHQQQRSSSPSPLSEADPKPSHLPPPPPPLSPPQPQPQQQQPSLPPQPQPQPQPLQLQLQPQPQHQHQSHLHSSFLQHQFQLHPQPPPIQQHPYLHHYYPQPSPPQVQHHLHQHQHLQIQHHQQQQFHLHLQHLHLQQRQETSPGPDHI